MCITNESSSYLDCKLYTILFEWCDKMYLNSLKYRYLWLKPLNLSFNRRQNNPGRNQFCKLCPEIILFNIEPDIFHGNEESS